MQLFFSHLFFSFSVIHIYFMNLIFYEVSAKYFSAKTYEETISLKT